MEEMSWQLRQGEELVGRLLLEGVDMFWTECRFVPGPGWEELRPLFDALDDAWRRHDEAAALAADDAIHARDLVLVAEDGGAPIGNFLIRVNGEKARFRY